MIIKKSISKNYFLFLILVVQISLINSPKISAQNVGIGINNPTARLDVAKPGGDTPTISLRGSINTSHFNHGVMEHTYIRGGKAASHVIVNDQGSGFVGIGTIPYSPLTFNNTLGQKISLFGTPTNSYGFGITPGTFQIHSFDVNGDIAFGYGSSLNFTERMRIKGNGNIGINTSSPTERLDVNGNINLTGLVKLTGNVGNVGHVLTSKGFNAPEWNSPTKFLYDNTVLKAQSSEIIISGAMGRTQLPGLTHTFTISQNAKAVINYSSRIIPLSCTFCGNSTIHMDIHLNGGLISHLSYDISNGNFATLCGTIVWNLSPGTHTIELSAIVNGPEVLFYEGALSGGRMVIQIIPE